MNKQTLDIIEQLFIDYQNNRLTYSQLCTRLDAYTYAEIQIVQTVMYIGRDYANKSDFFGSYNEMNDYMNSLVWNPDKSIEIGQIAEKQLVIADYFRNGRVILGI